MMTKERKRLYGIMRKKYGYSTSTTPGGYSSLSRIVNINNGEIYVGLVPEAEENSDPVVVIKSYATIGIDELITLGKIAEEFKKEMKEEKAKRA